MNGPAFPTDGPSALQASRAPAPAAAKSGFRLFGKDGFSFWDLVDIVNPLQHIPIVSTIYRKITGDVLDPLPRLAGGVLFGGITGAVAASVNLVVSEATGKDIGANALALLGDGLGFTGESDAAPPDAPPESLFARAKPDPSFSAGWQAALAMPYCDAECLDPKRSFFTDAATIAAARYAEAQGAAALGRRLDMQG